MDRQEFGQREEFAPFRETPLPQPIEVHFALREEDVVEGMSAILRLQRGRLASAVVIIGLGILMVMLGNLFFGLFMLTFALMFRRALVSTAKTKFRKEPLLQEPTSWTFTASEIRVDHPRSRAQHDWSVYKRVVETPHLFMLFPQDNLYNPVPKRAFADEDEIERFREMVRAQGIEYKTLGRVRQS